MASKSEKAAARAQKAAEARAAQAKAEARRRMLTIGGVCALIVVIVGGGILISVLTKKEVKAAPAGTSAYGVTIGEKDAPHEVIIYEDFLCPFCAQLEDASRDGLEELAADGKVLVEYRPFNFLGSLGDYPTRATNAFAVVMEKSGPEVAKKFHDLLFENQPPERDPDSASNDDLVDLAVEAGAEEADVRPGIEKLSKQDFVDGATKEAEKAGVMSTPTILLDGQVFEDGRTVEDRAENLIKELD